MVQVEGGLFVRMWFIRDLLYYARLRADPSSTRASFIFALVVSCDGFNQKGRMRAGLNGTLFGVCLASRAEGLVLALDLRFE